MSSTYDQAYAQSLTNPTEYWALEAEDVHWYKRWHTVLDDGGAEVEANQIGNIAVKMPLPPGCLPTLWNNDAGFEEAYLSQYPGSYLTADAGLKDEDGYLSVMSRTDDIINVAGHRLSTGGMEEVLASHPDVAECAVIGAADDIKGQVPLGFVVLKAG